MWCPFSLRQSRSETSRDDKSCTMRWCSGYVQGGRRGSSGPHARPLACGHHPNPLAVPNDVRLQAYPCRAFAAHGTGNRWPAARPGSSSPAGGHRTTAELATTLRQNAFPRADRNKPASCRQVRPPLKSVWPAWSAARLFHASGDTFGKASPADRQSRNE